MFEFELNCLIYNRDLMALERGSDYSGVRAINTAIRSLEAWQKVKEELKDEFTGLDRFLEKENTIRWVLRVIDNALGEVGETDG